LIYELDLGRVDVNQRAKYVGQRSPSSKGIVQTFRQTHTHTHTQTANRLLYLYH